MRVSTSDSTLGKRLRDIADPITMDLFMLAVEAGAVADGEPIADAKRLKKWLTAIYKGLGNTRDDVSISHCTSTSSECRGLDIFELRTWRSHPRVRVSVRAASLSSTRWTHPRRRQTVRDRVFHECGVSDYFKTFRSRRKYDVLRHE